MVLGVTACDQGKPLVLHGPGGVRPCDELP